MTSASLGSERCKRSAPAKRAAGGGSEDYIRESDVAGTGDGECSEQKPAADAAHADSNENICFTKRVNRHVADDAGFPMTVAELTVDAMTDCLARRVVNVIAALLQ